jgi:hypothetical protein
MVIVWSGTKGMSAPWLLRSPSHADFLITTNVLPKRQIRANGPYGAHSIKPSGSDPKGRPSHIRKAFAYREVQT